MSAADLPAFQSTFVGRASELARLHDLLEHGERLVTLFGSAGVGKTRIAVQLGAARPSVGRRPLAPLFCDLSTAQSGDDVCAAVARSLDVPTAGTSVTTELVDRLSLALAARPPTLLILDSFERVPPASAAILSEWHRAASEVVFVVTSRNTLRVAHERAVEITPLAVPGNDGTDPRDSDAVRLFLERAPSPLRNDNDTSLSTVAEIVGQLDGFPLAIELAAARLEIVSLDELHARLHQKLDLLHDPSGTSDSRHRSLWASIDWSWSVLKEHQRTALMQASVFEGGFTLEAAEAVIVPEPHRTVLDALQVLCRRSLVRSEAPASGEERRRFSMYQSIRSYASERLTDCGAAFTVEQRHSRYFVDRGVAAARAYETRDDRAALAFLEHEHANVLAVMRRALAARPATEASASHALGTAEAASPVLATRASLDAHREILDAAIAYATQVPSVRESAAFGRVLFARGYADRNSARADQAASDMLQARALGARHGDGELEASALRILGILAHFGGRDDEARRLYRDGLSVARACGCKTVEALLLYSLGTVDAHHSEFGAAATQCEEALAILRAVGHRRYEGIVLTNFGGILLEQRRLEHAKRVLEQAVDAHRASGNRVNEAISRGLLGGVDHLSGRSADARQAYTATLYALRELGDRRFEGHYFTYLAMLDLEGGDLDAGRAGLDRAARIAADVVDPRYEGIAQAMMAAERTLRGANHEAEGHLARAAVALESAGVPALSLLLQLPRALGEVARAREALRAGDHTGANACLERARSVADAMEHASTDDVTRAQRLLALQLDAVSALARTWALHAEGAWFQPPGAPPVVLTRRRPLARLLALLIRARRDDPRREIAPEQLVAAAWPGARLVPSAARNRLNVAISTLRKLGLAELLLRGKTGYVLDPQALTREDSGAAPAETRATNAHPAKTRSS